MSQADFDPDDPRGKCPELEWMRTSCMMIVRPLRMLLPFAIYSWPPYAHRAPIARPPPPPPPPPKKEPIRLCSRSFPPWPPRCGIKNTSCEICARTCPSAQFVQPSYRTHLLDPGLAEQAPRTAHPRITMHQPLPFPPNPAIQPSSLYA